MIPSLISILVAIILMLISILIYMSIKGKKKGLSIYIQSEDEKKKMLQEELRQQRNKNVQKKSWVERKLYKLQMAKLPFGLGGYFLIMFMGVVATYIIANFMIGSPGIAAVVSVCGIVVPEIIISFAERKARLQFEEAFIRALKNMSSVARSGGSIYQAVKSVRDTETLPILIREEFETIIEDYNTARIKTLDEGFFNLYYKTKNNDVLNVAIAIQIQEETGGNLAYLLNTIAEGISSKHLIQRQNRAVMSQAKLSGNFISIMPIVFVGIIRIVYPSYYDSLTKVLWGKILMAICFVVIIIGIMLVNKMSNIDVD